MKNRLVTPLLALASGIVLARFVHFHFSDFLWTLPLLSGLTCLAWRHSTAHPGGLLLALFCVLRRAFSQRPAPARQPSHNRRGRPRNGHPRWLRGLALGVFRRPRSVRSRTCAQSSRPRQPGCFAAGETPPDLGYGQLVELEARVRRIRNFQNPGRVRLRRLLRAQRYLLDRRGHRRQLRGSETRPLRIALLRRCVRSAHRRVAQDRTPVLGQSLCHWHDGGHAYRRIQPHGAHVDRSLSPHRHLPHAGDRRPAHHHSGGVPAVSAAALLSARNHRAGHYRHPARGSMRWFPVGTRLPSAPPADSRCTLPRATSIAGAVC